MKSRRQWGRAAADVQQRERPRRQQLDGSFQTNPKGDVACVLPPVVKLAPETAGRELREVAFDALGQLASLVGLSCQDSASSA
jgi:hypothetical protein